MDSGYIKLNRKLLNWYGFQNGNRLKLWIAILILANHKDKTILYNGKPLLIKRGTFVTSRGKLSELTKISRSYVDNLLNEFILQQQIQQDTCSTSRLITVLNYDTQQNYQPQVRPRRGQPRDHGEGTTNNVIMKECNNYKGQEASFTDFFLSIWSMYPKRVGRKDAERHFKASVKTDKDAKDIKTALDNYLSSKRVKGGYTQNGSTWFNNWQDWIEYSEKEDNKSGFKEYTG